MRKPIYIFLLGRPGCGKSEFFRRISKRIREENIAQKIDRIDDYPKLEAKWKVAREKKDFSRIKPSEDGSNLDSSFTIVDLSIYDEVLKELSEEIISKEKDYEVLFIEFSRPRNLEAIKNFSSEILEKSIAIYLDVPFEICWERIMKRIEKMKQQGIDAHLVPKEKMKSMYEYDDSEEFLRNSPVPVVHIQNREREGFETINKGVERAINLIKEKFIN